MITSSKTSNQNENLMTTVAENLTHNSAQDNQNALPASITAYFDTVILPLWLDIDPKSIDPAKIIAFLPCLAFFAGDRIEIRSELQTWVYQIADRLPPYLVNDLIKNCKSELSKVTSPYATGELFNPTINSDGIREDTEDFLISLGCKLSPPETWKALEHIAPFCKDEVEFTSIVGGKMRGLIYGFDDGEWKNAIADFKRRINDRRYERIKAEKNQVIQNTQSQVERAKNEIKQWLLEDDPVAKALTRSSLCRVYGLDKKTFDLIADSLDENSSKPKAKRLKPHEFMVLPTSGTPLLAPGIASMGVTIIAGNPGAGKTTLAYDLAGAVLMRDEFLGEVTSRQGSVLFVNCDEPHQWGQDKLINRGITSNYEVLMDWDVTQWSALETAVEDMRPALIVIDSFNAIHNDPNFDENSAQASQTVKKLDRLSAKYCVPTALIHHLGKSKDNKGVNKLRGSTAIAASVSSVLILEGEGTHKRLYQPKSRGSEPLDLTVEMDCENGRFRVTGGNITDDATKSVSQRLKDFYTANPGVYGTLELQDEFPDIPRKQLINGLNKLLGTVINGKPFIKRPSKINPRFKIYGIESTNDDNSSQLPPLSPSSFPVNFDDVTSESIDIQESQQITTTSQVTSQPRHNQNDDDPIVTPETLIQTENHQITMESQPRGERVPPVADDHDAVLTFGSVETASIIEVEKPNNLESENHQIVQPESINLDLQIPEPTKNETGFAFELGDRGRIGQRIKDKTTGEIHTIASIENGRYYCKAQDSFTSIPFADALTDLDPDEF